MKPGYTLNPVVMFQRVGDRMVLVNLQTNLVFELNDTGARVWELLRSGAGDEEILDQLTAEFEVGREQLRADVDDLLRTLTAKGLIS
jgi:hypothetical protein